MDEETAAMEAAQIRVERVDALKAMIGQKGEVITTLRPVGVVMIQGTRIDALAESGIIEEGEIVEVVDAYDNQLKVRTATNAT
jgi:membrane-bound ClpP family serine protease